MWSADGRQLYYVAPDGAIMSAAIHVGDKFLADTPRVLFIAHMRLATGVTRRQFDVSRDGRFLVNVNPPEAQSMPSITLVQNWTAKLPQ